MLMRIEPEKRLPLRVSLFRLSRRLLRPIAQFALARSLHSLFWLQIMRPHDLELITQLSYSGDDGESFASFEHNSFGLWEWEKAAFADSLEHCKNVLIIGAGAGREMIALGKMGFNVTGLEPSADLVAAGKRNLLEAGVQGDLRCEAPSRVPPEIGTFDAIILGRGVYHHIPRSHRRIRFLQECRAHLGPQGTLAVGDFHTRPSRRQRWFSLAGRLRDERGDALGGSYFHYFTQQEIEQEFAAAGFEIISYRPTPFPGINSLAHLVARGP